MKKKLLLSSRWLASSSFFLFFALASFVVQAATINVPADQPTIQAAINAANPGDVIQVAPNTYVIPSGTTINVNKWVTIDGGSSSTTKLQTSGTAFLFLVTAPNAAIKNFEIEKTDDNVNQEFVAVQASNFEFANNNVHALFNLTDVEVTRGLDVSTVSGLNIHDNIFKSLRQPAYINNAVAGTISNNSASITKGWVVVTDATLVFSNNSWGTGANSNVVDIAFINQSGSINNYPDIVAVSNANNGGMVENQHTSYPSPILTPVRVDASAAGVGNGTYLSPYATIGQAIPRSAVGGKILVAAGTYNEEVNLSKSLQLIGAGIDQSTIVGPIGGADNATIRISASNVTVQGFTVTRYGNNAANWTNSGLNTAGLAIQGTSVANATIQFNKFSGNRTAIDINNSNGHTVKSNIIDGNRTGMVFRNQTDNMTVENNYITNNYTLGIVFLDASGGTNSPVQTALNSSFRYNNISGNWYAQVVDRQTGGALPAPGANPKNFNCNWYGTSNPVVTTNNSTEPSGNSPFPTVYGGTDDPPGGQPDIAGSASANIQYVPFLPSDAHQAAMIGFVPTSQCSGGTHVHNTTQGTHYLTIQSAVNAANPGDVIVVDAGTYNENVTINTQLILKGANYSVSCSGNRGAESVVNGQLGSGTTTIKVNSDNVTIDGFSITNHNGSLGISESGRSNQDYEHNLIYDIGNPTAGQYSSWGVDIEAGTNNDSHDITVSNNCINNIRGGGNISLNASTTPTGKANNGSGGGILFGSSGDTKTISNVVINANIIDHITASTVAFADGGKGAYGIQLNVHGGTGGVTSPSITNNEINTLEGLWAHGVGLEGRTPGAQVTNNLIDKLVDHKGNTDAVGVRLEDNDGAGTVAINSNSFTNMPFGISNTTLTTVDGKCNWYGTVDGSVIATKIQGPVTYDSWLNSGNDGSSNVGFQPTGSCTGTANDYDGDGNPNATDCAPVDPTNDDAPTMWWKDADGDGYGNPNISVESCTQPAGFVANNYDCDDNSKAKKPEDEQVLMCHDGKPQCVKAKDVQGHLNEKNNNWTLGPCDPACKNGKVLMCHNGKPQCVDQKDVNKNLAKKGWSLGYCGDLPSSISASVTNASIDAMSTLLATELSISNYPNPFTRITTLQYQLPVDGKVSLKVFDILGRPIATLVDGNRSAGTYNVNFDGSKLSKGNYYFRIIVNTIDNKQLSGVGSISLIK
jgi:regulator of RNase E activity RraA